MNSLRHLRFVACLSLISAAATHFGCAAPAAPKRERIMYSEVNVDGPFIALTFDDGPHAKNTPRLLDLLAEKHIKATFFVLGENATRYPDIMKRIVQDGHEIASHTWTHLNCAKSSDSAVRGELQRTDKKIAELTGVKPSLMRPPYGSMGLRQRQWVHAEFGYKIIMWDVDPLDWREPGVDVVAQRIINGTRGGSIILSHDIHAPTIEAMPKVIDALLAKGFKFLTVSELIAKDKGGERPEIPKTEPAPLAPSATKGAAPEEAAVPAGQPAAPAR